MKLLIASIFQDAGEATRALEIAEIIREYSKGYSGLILAPKEICSLEEIRPLLKNENVYITDQCVPAAILNEKAEAVICHGGQGTLQTAIKGGAPMAAVAMQPEQQMNIQHLAAYGAAIPIKRRDFTWETLLTAVETLPTDSSFKENILALKRTAEETDTEKIIGEAFWNRIVK